MRRIVPVGFSILLLLTFCSAQDNTATQGSIRGEVVARNQNGEPAVLPDARIVLNALMHSEDISYKPLRGEVELCLRVGRMGSIK
jgi:hypothetical protein